MFIALRDASLSMSDDTGQPHDLTIPGWADQPTSPEDLAQRVEQLLESNGFLRGWYLDQLTAGGFAMPPCTGRLFASCREELEGDGFEVHRTERGIDEVPDGDIELGAGAVVETSPAGGSDTTPGQDIEVTTNPERQPALPGGVPEENDPECDYGPDGSIPSSWDLEGGRFTEATGFLGSATLGVDPDVEGSEKAVKLRYGTLDWGRLHIAEGHGWNAETERDSRLAITFGHRSTVGAFPPRFLETEPRECVALLPQRNVGIKLCGRFVKAELAYDPEDAFRYPGDVDGRERGVITSFGFAKP